ncbi:MAG: DUF4492 domain-containing protein [Rikenellaceae bacterium]
MNRLKTIYQFYYRGFKEMTVGRTLWLIIAIKLFVMFAILKVFFFQSHLSGKSEAEKAVYVRQNLTNIE